MKKIVTEDRYEAQGSPLCWIWGFIGLVWAMQSVLRMTEGEGGLLVVFSWICAAASLLNAVIWMRYRLTADERGLTMTQAWSTVSFAWEELEKVTAVELSQRVHKLMAEDLGPENVLQPEEG